MAMSSFLRSIFKRVFNRKEERKAATFTVRLFPKAVKNKNNWVLSDYQTISKNISPHGIRIETSAPIEVKDRVSLMFSLIKASKVIYVEAVATNVIIQEHGKREAGLEFQNPDPEAVKHLKTILTIY